MELFPYTKNNHFKWGWDGLWYGEPNPQGTYQVHLGAVSRPVKSFREECVQAVTDLAESSGRPMLVGLSGGSDSQIVCLSLLEAKIPFTALIVSYVYRGGDCVNQHDIAVAYEFCKKFSVPYRELTIDIDVFYRDRAPAIAKKYCMPKLETIIQCAAMDYAGNDWCYVMGGGDMMLIPVPAAHAQAYDVPLLNNKFSVPCWWESPVPVMQYMLDQGYHGTSKFFLYSPELIAAYLQDSVVQNFLDHADVLLDAYIDLDPSSSNWWKCFHYLYKPQLTLREFPEIIRSRKFTGFEEFYHSRYRPSKMTVYNEILSASVQGLPANQKVLVPIADVLEYVTTAHSPTDVLTARTWG